MPISVSGRPYPRDKPHRSCVAQCLNQWGGARLIFDQEVNSALAVAPIRLPTIRASAEKKHGTSFQLTPWSWGARERGKGCAPRIWKNRPIVFWW
jgi:hypothetical protein